jgi:hypothetical protein
VDFVLTGFITVIQGTVDADTKGKLTQEEVSRTVEFAFRSWITIDPAQKEALVQKLKSFNIDSDADDEQTIKAIDGIQKQLTPEESQALNTLRGRKMLRHEDIHNIDNFTKDSINGLVAIVERGKLGLRKSDAPKVSKADLFSLGFLEGHAPDLDKVLTKKEEELEKDSNNTNGHIDITNGTEKASHATSFANGIYELNGTPKTSGSGLDKVLQPVLPVGQLLDEASRHFLINTFHEAAEKLETPHDTMRRFADSVCYYPSLR